MTNLVDARRGYSSSKLTELRSRIAATAQEIDVPDLAVFAGGSYARLEASEHSDIDLFFVYGSHRRHQHQPHTNELRLFGRLIEAANEMGFPAFSGDARYLRTVSCQDILDDLGSPRDDAENYFTLRMLLMLESKPLFGDEAYKTVLSNIIDAYYRDYPDHQEDFRPWFLINDISRFWKTLLLNYEHKRNQREVSDKEKAEQKVKNFKTKYSRMVTCHATIAALAAQEDPIRPESLSELFAHTPRERLDRVAELHGTTQPLITEIHKEYSWFLDQTGLPTEDLTAQFSNPDELPGLFKRATVFGGMMFDLLQEIETLQQAKGRGFMRYLVI